MSTGVVKKGPSDLGRAVDTRCKFDIGKDGKVHVTCPKPKKKIYTPVCTKNLKLLSDKRHKGSLIWSKPKETNPWKIVKAAWEELRAARINSAKALRLRAISLASSQGKAIWKDPKIKKLWRETHMPHVYAATLVSARLATITKEMASCSKKKLKALNKELKLLKKAVKLAGVAPMGDFVFGSAIAIAKRAKMQILLGALNKDRAMYDEGLRVAELLTDAAKVNGKAKKIRSRFLRLFPAGMRKKIIYDSKFPILSSSYSKGSEEANGLHARWIFKELESTDPAKAEKLKADLAVLVRYGGMFDSAQDLGEALASWNAKLGKVDRKAIGEFLSKVEKAQAKDPKIKKQRDKQERIAKLVLAIKQLDIVMKMVGSGKVKLTDKNYKRLMLGLSNLHKDIHERTYKRGKVDLMGEWVPRWKNRKRVLLTYARGIQKKWAAELYRELRDPIKDVEELPGVKVENFREIGRDIQLGRIEGGKIYAAIGQMMKKVEIERVRGSCNALIKKLDKYRKADENYLTNDVDSFVLQKLISGVKIMGQIEYKGGWKFDQLKKKLKGIAGRLDDPKQVEQAISDFRNMFGEASELETVLDEGETTVKLNRKVGLGVTVAWNIGLIMAGGYVGKVLGSISRGRVLMLLGGAAKTTETGWRIRGAVLASDVVGFTANTVGFSTTVQALGEGRIIVFNVRTGRWEVEDYGKGLAHDGLMFGSMGLAFSRYNKVLYKYGVEVAKLGKWGERAYKAGGFGVEFGAFTGFEALSEVYKQARKTGFNVEALDASGKATSKEAMWNRVVFLVGLKMGHALSSRVQFGVSEKVTKFVREQHGKLYDKVEASLKDAEKNLNEMLKGNDVEGTAGAMKAYESALKNYQALLKAMGLGYSPQYDRVESVLKLLEGREGIIAQAKARLKILGKDTNGTGSVAGVKGKEGDYTYDGSKHTALVKELARMPGIEQVEIGENGRVVTRSADGEVMVFCPARGKPVSKEALAEGKSTAAGLPPLLIMVPVLQLFHRLGRRQSRSVAETQTDPTPTKDVTINEPSGNGTVSAKTAPQRTGAAANDTFDEIFGLKAARNDDAPENPADAQWGEVPYEQRKIISENVYSETQRAWFDGRSEIADVGMTSSDVAKADRMRILMGTIELKHEMLEASRANPKNREDIEAKKKARYAGYELGSEEDLATEPLWKTWTRYVFKLATGGKVSKAKWEKRNSFKEAEVWDGGTRRFDIETDADGQLRLAQEGNRPGPTNQLLIVVPDNAARRKVEAEVLSRLNSELEQLGHDPLTRLPSEYKIKMINEMRVGHMVTQTIYDASGYTSKGTKHLTAGQAETLYGYSKRVEDFLTGKTKTLPTLSSSDPVLLTHPSIMVLERLVQFKDFADASKRFLAGETDAVPVPHESIANHPGVRKLQGIMQHHAASEKASSITFKTLFTKVGRTIKENPAAGVVMLLLGAAALMDPTGFSSLALLPIAGMAIGGTPSKDGKRVAAPSAENTMPIRLKGNVPITVGNVAFYLEGGRWKMEALGKEGLWVSEGGDWVPLNPGKANARTASDGQLIHIGDGKYVSVEVPATTSKKALGLAVQLPKAMKPAGRRRTAADGAEGLGRDTVVDYRPPTIFDAPEVEVIPSRSKSFQPGDHGHLNIKGKIVYYTVSDAQSAQVKIVVSGFLLNGSKHDVETAFENATGCSDVVVTIEQPRFEKVKHDPLRPGEETLVAYLHYEGKRVPVYAERRPYYRNYLAETRGDNREVVDVTIGDTFLNDDPVLNAVERSFKTNQKIVYTYEITNLNHGLSFSRGQTTQVGDGRIEVADSGDSSFSWTVTNRGEEKIVCLIPRWGWGAKDDVGHDITLIKPGTQRTLPNYTRIIVDGRLVMLHDLARARKTDANGEVIKPDGAREPANTASGTLVAPSKRSTL